MLDDHRVGQPRVVHADAAAERREQRHQRASDVAEADDADVCVEQRLRLDVPAPAVRFAAGAERAVGARDAAHKIQRQRERVFGDGRGKRGGRDGDADAMRKAIRVIDIGKEIALDIEDRAQRRRAFEPRGGQRRLAQNRAHPRQAFIDDGGVDGARFGSDHVGESFQALPVDRRKNHRARARMRIEQDERFRHRVQPAGFVTRSGSRSVTSCARKYSRTTTRSERPTPGFSARS